MDSAGSGSTKDARAAREGRAKILVLGVGNPILSDDGVGIHVMHEVSRRLEHPLVEYGECSLAGFGLLDVISGYEKLIIIDAITWGRSKPGSLIVLEAHELEGPERLRNFHTLSLPGVLRLAGEMNIDVPGDILLFAVEASDCTTFSEECTPEVERALPGIADRVVGQLERWIAEYEDARSGNST